LGKELQFKTIEDWYRVTVEDIHEHGGVRLLNGYYNDSPYQALQTIYPQHNWLGWKFGLAPKGFWDKRENTEQFLGWLGNQLGYTSGE